MDTPSKRDTISLSTSLASDQGDSSASTLVNPEVLADKPVTDSTTNATPVTDDSVEGVLSASDLVKIFEITLAEIRSSQTFAFSVLGFALACGAIIQRMHDPPRELHDMLSFGSWAIGVLFCLVGAALIGLAGSHHSPLQDFIIAAEPGKPEFLLPVLRGALNKAKISVRWFHWFKRPILIGALFVVLAVLIEVFSSIPMSSVASQK